MGKPVLWIEVLNDSEVADVMSEVTEDYFPGQRMVDALALLDESEIDFAVNVLVPVL